MGRAPCCDKANVKRGPWSPEEDATLKNYLEKQGTGGNWISLPQKAGLRRCGKSCRLRWLNYLRPDIKRGSFSEEEDNIIFDLYGSIGSRWSVIAAQLPGRTDNDVKNYWNTKLKKKLFLAGLHTSPKSNETSHLNFAPISAPTSKVETYDHVNSACFDTNSNVLSYPVDANSLQNCQNSQELILDQTQFPLSRPMQVSADFGTSGSKSTYSTITSSQDVSSLSSSSSLGLENNSKPFWSGINGGVKEEGILLDFVFDQSHEDDDHLLDGFVFQEDNNEVPPYLGNSPYISLLQANSSGH